MTRPLISADELVGHLGRVTVLDVRSGWAGPVDPRCTRRVTCPARRVLDGGWGAWRRAGRLVESGPVAGHIPGAVNVPTGVNLRADGTVRPAVEIRALYAAAGAAGDRPVGVYCGSGVTAAHDVLTLATTGVEGVLYPGSWSEWVADPERPVTTGAG